MKINVDTDEMWPYHFPADRGMEVEVPDDFMRKWKRVSGQFAELQQILAGALNPETTDA